MTAAPGIVTSGTGPPNAVVQVQPGMNVQPVVLVDQSGNFLATSGSAATAGYLADASGSVAVFAAAAPTTGQVLTATSGTTATWQAGGGGSGTATTLATLTTGVYVAGGSAPTTGQVLTATSGTAATWQVSPAGFANPMTTGGDMLFESGVPAPARLAGNTSGTKEFLTGTGSGGTANAPAWGTIAVSDVPVLNQNTTGTATTATALSTASGSVSVSAATAPAVSQTLTATSGTTATWQNGAAAVLTALGDTLYENATPALARLAGNTGTQKMFLSQAGNGTVSAAPAWSAVSGQYLCAPVTYAPGTAVTLSTSGSALTAVSSANINTGSFTAPPSGNVIVTASMVCSQTTTADWLTFGLASHGGTVPVCNNSNTQCLSGGRSLPYTLTFLVTSLAAGSAYNFDLMYAATGGAVDVFAYGYSASIASNTAGGPVTMTVQAV